MNARLDLRGGFDWRTIAARIKPGPAAKAIEESLGAWASVHGIPDTRVRTTAYYITAVCPRDTPQERLFLLARYVLWIFWFDEYDLHDLRDDAVADGMDRDFRALTAALVASGGLSRPLAASLGLTAEGASLRACSRLGRGLTRALVELCEDMLRAWEQTHPHDGAATRAIRQQRCILWLAAMLGAARREIARSRDYLTRGRLPPADIDVYLADTGQWSIAVPAIAALIDSFEPDPERVWPLACPAVAACSRVIRLTNDLGNYWDELHERKFNAVTIALLRLGCPPFAAYTTTSREVARARSLTEHRLRREIDAFLTEVQDLPEGPLRAFLWRGTAMALAMYEPGDFVIPGA